MINCRGMAARTVELLAIGAGPSNLALAVALEELPGPLARRSLLVEKEDAVAWQRGMLMPWALSQVSFLKDLVLFRNPRSRFTFLNYLHSVGRLIDFVPHAASSAERDIFWRFHGAYSVVELLKLALGLFLSGRLVFGRNRIAGQVDVVDEADHRHVNR